MNLQRAFFGVIALLGLGTTAQAAYIPTTWNDSVNVLAGGNYIAAGQSRTYTHNLNPEFRPGTDFITGYELTINLFDDQKDSWLDFEAVRLDDILGLPFGLALNFSNYTYEGAFLTGWVELNLLGTLTVSITSLNGDFMFGGSQLFATGYAQTTSVPEPATLGLLGMGLLGVAAGARRRRKAST